MPQAFNSRHDSRYMKLVNWLLEEDQPSVRYHTLVDLLERREDDPEVRDAYSRIPRIGWARDILKLQKPKGFWESHGPTNALEWLNFLRVPEYVATTWRAIVLSDMGLTSRDPRIRKIADCFFEYKLKLGTMINIFNEEVCYVGNTARMMTRFGYGDDYRVKKLYDWLIEDQRDDGGWNCSQGTPGTLDSWEALAAFAAMPKSKRSGRIERSVTRGAEFYLERRLFQEGRKYAPWLRFHYPNHIYYDILVGLDMITKLGFADDRAPRRKWNMFNCIRTGIKRPDAGPAEDMAACSFPCSNEDGGGPPGAAMQVEAPNHRKLLWSKAMVVSVTGKGPA